MTLSIKKILVAMFLTLAFVSATEIVLAQESQMLSVTPPLFQLSALPGDVWQSSIKVVNGNDYPLTVYAEVVNFSPTGEAGQGRFIPIAADITEKVTPAQWINIQKGSYVISPEQTQDISFFVDIPKDAPPGGHYAAILISTQPPAIQDEKLAVQTSQAVTSLLFMRIEGDVRELGAIREFRALDALIPRPETEFSLRFENKGNVHLQPRGDIVITNMWGTERGRIPVNYQTHFGNVLPASIREFKFAWKSDFNVTDIGRYKAVATLAYGEDDIQSVTATAYFWVIPLKVTFITLVILGTFIALIVWMVRRYVRRMLILAGVNIDTEKRDQTRDEMEAPIVIYRKQKVTAATISAPIRDGALDLRQRLSTVDESVDVLKTVFNFIAAYKVFFISICILIMIFVSGVLYITKATEEHQNYTVIIDDGEGEAVLEVETHTLD